MSKKPKKSDGFEDISSHSRAHKRKEKAEDRKEARANKSASDKKRDAIIGVLCVMLCLVIVACGAVAVFVRTKFNKMNYSDGTDGNPDATFSYIEEENLNFQQISDIAYADSVKDCIKSWATNGGDQLYSKNVINVLLIGEDNEDGSHRSDTAILATVNKKERKIILTSFLRDSYTYMNINGQDRYDKTNHSYSWGGAAKLMEVLSNNYKIKIDHFVTINYRSFIDAVDKLGGVNVMVTDAEANFMNRTTKMKGFESGPSVNLDGEHALVFARIRKLDGEPERTERQRRLLTACIESVKDSTLSEINAAIDTFLPYVTTNYRESEIVSLATKAVTEGWLKYDIVSQVAPSEESRMGFQGYRTYTGYLDVWIVDYIKAARELQLSLYGQTNITVNEETHISAINLALGSSYSNSENYDDADDENDDDDDGDFSLIPEYSIPNFDISDLEEEWGLTNPFYRPNRGDREEETSAYYEEPTYEEEEPTDYGYYSEEELTEEY